MAFCHNLARNAEQDIKDSHWDRQEMLNKCREECQEEGQKESTFDPFDYQPFYLDPDDSLDDGWPGYEYFGHREY